MMKITRASTLGLAVLLTGCSGMSDSLGFGRSSPDAFAVVDRPPLAMPPNYALRPPQPGAPRPQEISMTDKAARTLYGTTLDAVADKTASEAALLASAGAQAADPNIREVIDREAAERVVGSRRLVDEILWWRQSEPASTTVDPVAEAERLRALKDEDKSVTQGATPIIRRGRSGWLGS